MRRRHPPIPKRWLMTDERMGDALWEALERLPRGSGVVFRHYGLPAAQRRALFKKIAAVAARRRLVLLWAGDTRVRRRSQGTHGRTAGRAPGLRTMPAHSRREALKAVRAGADAVFVSPVYPTRSHPGARSLGRVRLGLISRGLGLPVIALGGMTERRALGLAQLGVHGWAAIDAWTAR